MPPTIAVLDYGSGNLHSVSRALQAAGAQPVVTADAEEVARADALVIPGVGHFGQCMRAIAGLGLDGVVRDVTASDTPVFGVCVGMQVLFEGSDEDAEPGLGILDGTCRLLPPTVKVPHMGWNTVAWLGSHPYVAGIPESARFYFVHSYAPDVSDAATIGVTEHGRPFSAVATAGNVFATQFHPEKSGGWGLHLYRNFVESVAAA
jgi:imidazole glycerol-phosphate synthase subunit HisH